MLSPVPDITDIHEEINRLLQAPEFVGSKRGQTLLTYLVENAAAGNHDRLKERSIGVAIFGRDATYDTGQDAIVRVSVNSLRKRLSTYYSRLAAEGVHPKVHIQLAPGSYTPEFRFSEVPQPAPAEPPAVDQVMSTPRRSFTWLHGTICILAVACIGLLAVNFQLAARHPVAASTLPLPWSMLTAFPEARVVLTDANFTLHQFYFRNRSMTLDEYASQKWLWDLRAKEPSVLPLSGAIYTSVTSAQTAARIGAILDRGKTGSDIDSARSLQLRDFKEDRPVVLIGNPPANPWVELFHDRMNFILEFDGKNSEQVCINRHPQAGEQPRYATPLQRGSPHIVFASIVLTSNLTGKAPVLIVAGNGAEATEAAGEFVTDLPRLTGELRKRGIDPNSKVRHLELVLRVYCTNQGPSRSEVFAHRVVR